MLALGFVQEKCQTTGFRMVRFARMNTVEHTCLEHLIPDVSANERSRSNHLTAQQTHWCAATFDSLIDELMRCGLWALGRTKVDLMWTETGWVRGDQTIVVCRPALVGTGDR